MQVHPVPEIAVIVSPAGGVSVTVTAPLDAEAPTFDTEMTYVRVCPGSTVCGLCLFVMARSAPAAGAVMVVGSVAVLLPVFDSPPPATVAVLVNVPGTTLAAMLVVTVIGG